MAESMNCDICGKPATVHLTQIINNKIKKIDLCESCAQEKGVTDPDNFSLSDLVGSTGSNIAEEYIEQDASGLRCPNCGTTPNSFKKHGRLGCPQCYDALRPILMPMFENMHKGSIHKGKKPAGIAEKHLLLAELNDLEVNLKKAIEEERYEDAASYRDQIHDLKAKKEEQAHEQG
jgi:protein arginine kinase activator